MRYENLSMLSSSSGVVYRWNRRSDRLNEDCSSVVVLTIESSSLNCNGLTITRGEASETC